MSHYLTPPVCGTASDHRRTAVNRCYLCLDGSLYGSRGYWRDFAGLGEDSVSPVQAMCRRHCELVCSSDPFDPRSYPNRPQQHRSSSGISRRGSGRNTAVYRHMQTPSDCPKAPGLLRAESGLRDGPHFFLPLRNDSQPELERSSILTAVRIE